MDYDSPSDVTYAFICGGGLMVFTLLLICCLSACKEAAKDDDFENAQRQVSAGTQRPEEVRLPQSQNTRFEHPKRWDQQPPAEDKLPSYEEVTSTPSYISSIYNEKISHL